MVRPRSGIDGTLRFGPEQPGEAAGIAEVHRAAFGGEYEADVVAGLREGGFAFASLVARLDTTVLAHVMFSDISVVVDGRTVKAAALAPLAVAEGWRGAGIGGRLVQMGLEACAAHGSAVVVVLGDPDYYGRFGFSVAAMAHLDTPYGRGKLMALELVAGALAGAGGVVRYPAPFSRAQ